MPLTLLFQIRQVLLPIQSVLLRHNLFQRLQNTGHHTLQTAKVNVRTIVQSLQNHLRIFREHVLHVEFATIVLVGHFPGNGVRGLKVLRVGLHHFLKFIVVQQPTRHGHAQDQPGLSIVQVSGDGVFGKQASQKGAKGSNAGSRGDHDEVRVLIIVGQEHGLADGTGDLDFFAGGNVAEVIAANSLFGRIDLTRGGVHVLGPSHAERDCFSVEQFTITRRGDTVQTWFVGLSLFIETGRNDGNTLTFQIVHPLGQLHQHVLNIAGRRFGNEGHAAQHRRLGRSIGLGKGAAGNIFQKVLCRVQGFGHGHGGSDGLGGAQIVKRYAAGNAFLARRQFALFARIKQEKVARRDHGNAATILFNVIQVQRRRGEGCCGCWCVTMVGSKGFDKTLLNNHRQQRREEET
mmetsp:Transcript_4161/g.8618  ORF Transcript_4161/g.8618 Transcript_4161/m.8618 type:complete len:404 (-) Transcript_4161:117-1328(-)